MSHENELATNKPGTCILHIHLHAGGAIIRKANKSFIQQQQKVFHFTIELPLHWALHECKDHILAVYVPNSILRNDSEIGGMGGIEGIEGIGRIQGMGGLEE